MRVWCDPAADKEREGGGRTRYKNCDDRYLDCNIHSMIRAAQRKTVAQRDRGRAGTQSNLISRYSQICLKFHGFVLPKPEQLSKLNHYPVIRLADLTASCILGTSNRALTCSFAATLTTHSTHLSSVQNTCSRSLDRRNGERKWRKDSFPRG